jgi:hypothetical protein
MVVGVLGLLSSNRQDRQHQPENKVAIPLPQQGLKRRHIHPKTLTETRTPNQKDVKHRQQCLRSV